MSSSHRNPNTLADWIQLDYHERPRAMRRKRKLLFWTVFILGILAIAWTFLPPFHSVHQAGPLATAHSMFENDCAQCHKEPWKPVQRLLPGGGLVRSVSDEACLACHDGAIHHEQQAFTPGCATCHREHRGQPVLARVHDSHCTACHSSLQRKDGQGCEFENVSRFPRDHPEFALLRDPASKDPAALKFNHEHHLSELRNAQGETVTLDCNACHEPESDGRYMKPIHYESHCADCHPLSVQLPGGGAGRVQQAIEKFNGSPAPHEAPPTLRAELRERLIELTASYSSLLKETSPAPLRRIPGNSARSGVTESEWQFIEAQLANGLNTLLKGAGGCRHCHVSQDSGEEAGNPTYSLSLPSFEETNIPDRWFHHAKFNHDSHRGLDCTECHDAHSSHATTDILLPNVKKCAECHNPGAGARSDCVECHSYHGHPKAAQWKGHLKIEDMLGN